MMARKYNLSNYITSTRVDNNKYLIFSGMSCSLILLEKAKYDSLIKMKLNDFNQTEINKLIKMNYITSINESVFLNELKTNVVKNINNEPLSLSVLTTTSCNAKCSYCYEKGIKTETMNIKTAENLIQFIRQNYHNKPIKITWFGGEPLLNYKIIDYISNNLEINGIKFISNIVSNGYLFNKINSSHLKKWNLKKAQITLDAINDEYNEIKKITNNAFLIVISNIKSLLDNKIYVSIRINFDPVHVSRSIQTIDFLYKKFGLNKYLSIYCFNIVDSNVENVNDDKYKIENGNPYLILMHKLIDYGYIKSLKALGLNSKRTYCGINHNYFVINPSGTIFKCEHSCNKPNESIGNLNTHSFNEHELKKWTSTDFIIKNCKKCKLLPCCQGGCKSMLIDYGKRACPPFKKYIKPLLKMLYNKYWSS